LHRVSLKLWNTLNLSHIISFTSLQIGVEDKLGNLLGFIDGMLLGVLLGMILGSKLGTCVGNAVGKQSKPHGFGQK